MRMPELKSLARDRGLRNYSRMRKALARNQTLIIFSSWRDSVINELRKKSSSYLTVYVGIIL